MGNCPSKCSTNKAQKARQSFNRQGCHGRGKHLLVTEQWSLEQISGVLGKDGKYISHETIYRMIRKDKAEGGTLYKHCRHKLKRRARPVGGRRISIPNRTSISERPAEVDGKRFGDFEMDTIVGRGNHGAIVTLIERSTNMLFMRKLKRGKMPKSWHVL